MIMDGAGGVLHDGRDVVHGVATIAVSIR
jgi:hypothetical protein